MGSGKNKPTLRSTLTFTDRLHSAPFDYLGMGKNNSLRLASNFTHDHPYQVFGVETQEQADVRLEMEATAEAAAEESKARSKAYNAALTEDIDSVTRSEIVNMYQKGSSSVKLASLLNKARDGKGIYAVRKVDDAQKSYATNQPGRAQTVLSLGRGTVLN